MSGFDHSEDDTSFNYEPLEELPITNYFLEPKDLIDYGIVNLEVIAISDMHNETLVVHYFPSIRNEFTTFTIKETSHVKYSGSYIEIVKGGLEYICYDIIRNYYFYSRLPNYFLFSSSALSETTDKLVAYFYFDHPEKLKKYIQFGLVKFSKTTQNLTVNL